MELDIMWKSRIENKVLLRQMGAGLVDTKRVLINNGKIKSMPGSHESGLLSLGLCLPMGVGRDSPHRSP